MWIVLTKNNDTFLSSSCTDLQKPTQIYKMLNKKLESFVYRIPRLMLVLLYELKAPDTLGHM